IEELSRALDFESHQVAKIVVAAGGGDLRFRYAEAGHGIARDVDAIALNEVARDILPEVGELQRGARAVGEALALFVPVSAEVEHKAPHWVGAAAAVITELLEGVVAVDALVLFERIDQIEERLGRDVVAFDRVAQRDED